MADEPASTRKRTALLVDFDNIFGFLLALDRGTTIRFAEDPITLVDGMRTADPSCDILVRRVDLNPAGWLTDHALGNEQGRLFLQRFRPNLVRAGFHVVDCAALTSMQKNAADIRMVLDVIDLIDHPTHFDEFIVVSGDADFTPLLQRLRALDRRTTIVTAGPIARAYRAVADSCVEGSELISLINGSVPTVSSQDDGDDAAAALPPTGSEYEDLLDLARSVIVRTLDESSDPVLLAQIGHDIHGLIGSARIKATRWFGYASLGALVTATNPNYALAAHWAWDRTRHEPPTEDEVSAASALSRIATFPPFIASICRLTDMPRLASSEWPLLFSVLADYAANHAFSLTESTAWTRDRMADAGNPVGRQQIGFVVQGSLFGGCSLGGDPPPDAEAIRGAFARSVLVRADGVGVEIGEAEKSLLDTWLRGDWREEEAVGTATQAGSTPTDLSVDLGER